MCRKPTYEELEERVKRLEKKVRSYEEFKDVLIETEGSCCRLQKASFEGISVCEEGIILEANRALSTITGYDGSELIGMDILNLFTPEWRDFVRYNIDSMFDNPYEAICLKKDSTSIPVEIQGENVNFLGRQQRVVSVRDIGERKQAEELYKTIAEESQAGVYVVQDGKFIYVNDNAANYTGYTPQELAGKESLFCVHSEDKKIIAKNLKRGRAIRITILLADDHKIFRDGLRMLIEKEPDMEVIAEADDGRRAVELVKQLTPDIVIMDITMPDMNGIDATRAISKESPDTRIIALSMHSDRRLTSAMLEAGASGYLTKDCTFEELLATIANAGKDKFQSRNR